MRNCKIFILLVLLIFTLSCKKKDEYKPGVVKYWGGVCSYLIELDDKIVLEPTNLDNKYRIDSLKVLVKYEEVVTITHCGMGIMVGIKDIKKQ